MKQERRSAAMRQAVGSYNNPLMPTAQLVAQARDILHQIPQDHPRFSLVDRKTGKTLDMDLPDEIYSIIHRVLVAIAQNQAVNLLPTNLELTTNQAADLLNVSRGFIINLINRKEIKCHMVGTHRRIRLEDVLSYKDKMYQQTSEALKKLTTLDQELELEE